MKLKYIAIFALIISFTGVSSAQTTDADLRDFQKFEDNIDKCTGSSCTTEDSAALTVENGVMHIDSGDTGFCGEAGYQLSGQMEGDAKQLVFESRAERDRWGSSIQGLRINDDLVFNYGVETPESNQWEWSEHSVDVSQYAGQNVTLSFVIGDNSQEYCNNLDHGKELHIKNVRLKTSQSDSPDYESIDLNFDKENYEYGDKIIMNVTDGRGNLIEPGKAKVKIQSSSDKVIVEDELFDNPSIGEVSEDFIPSQGTYEAEAAVESGSKVLRDQEDFTVRRPEENYDSINLEVSEEPVAVGEEARIEVRDGDGNLVPANEVNYQIVDPTGELLVDRTLSDNPSVDEVSSSLSEGTYSVKVSVESGSRTLYDSGQLEIISEDAKIEDLNEIDALTGRAALIYPSDARQSTLKSAKSLARDYNLEPVSDQKSSFDAENAVIYGGPAINQIAENAASEGLIWGNREYSEGVGRLALIKETGAAIVISGYSSEERQEAVSYFERLMQGENLEVAEGKQSLTVTTPTSPNNSESNEKPSITEVDHPSSITRGDSAVFWVNVQNPTDQLQNMELKLRYAGQPARRSDYYDINVSSDSTGDVSFTQDFLNTTVQKSLGTGDTQFTMTLFGDYEVLDTYVGDIRIKEPERSNQNQSEDYRPISIQMSEGWNMISVPGFRRMGSSAPVEGFYISDIKDDCSLQEYEGHYSWSLEGGEWEHPEAVKYNQGVYVKASESCEAEIGPKWPVSGEPVEESRKLEEGWNMISVKSNTRLENLKTDCQFETFKENKVWHYSGQLWQKFNEGLLRADKGYYVKAAESCQIGVSQKPPTPTGNFFKLR